MDRKKFIKNSLVAATAAIIAPSSLKAESKSTYDKLMEPIGFNHLPNKELKTMNTVIHRADTRGHADHGWLNAKHSFSFANYYNPERVHFGVLRVLNDDTIAGGRGFGTHPHDNMEIITIPLEGALEHKDNMGNGSIINAGDVQVMSAGTGIQHSEFNANKKDDVRLFQIWLFPREKDVTPRYEQLSIKGVAKHNEFYQILSPSADDQGVWIHQDAWFNLGQFDKGLKPTYNIKKKGNGVYLMVVDGSIEINGETLNQRDAIGIWDVDEVSLTTTADARILLLEVPMTV